MQEPGEPKFFEEEQEHIENNGEQVRQELHEALETKEELSDKEYLEKAREVGDEYLSMIREMIGQEEQDAFGNEQADGPENEVLAFILKSVRNRKREQHVFVESKEMGAKEMLEQAYPQEQYKELLEDTSKYRMEEVSEGIFIISMQFEFYQNFRRGSKAVTAKVPKGVSFIMVREPGNDSHIQSELEEDVLHEASHLASYFVQKEGVITSNEKDSDFQKAFLMYQEELITRIVSDGGLGGYTHLIMMSLENRESYKEDNPEKYEEILSICGSLNEFLKEFEETRIKTGVEKSDIIMSVMKATTFKELEENLQEVKSIIERQPVTQDEKEKDSSGWDFA